jgi:D-arabinose 1-dehydrogenase-like Zn-dependent alcohol dehydrogenase
MLLALNHSSTMIETAPLERATEAYDRMMKNEARFRLGWLQTK